MEALIHLLVRVSDAVYLALNGLSGRSWLADTLISLPVDNPLVKGGPIGAALVYAWFAGRDAEDVRRRRGRLIVTLGALALVLAATKTIGGDVFIPRPFVQSQTAFHLEDGKLVQSVELAYRVPLAGGSRDRFEALQRGEVIENDLVSLPSDHAGFFFALALGIFLACRRAGAVALAWTVFAILLGRIVTGMHSPLDIAAGAALGGSIMLAAHWAARFARRASDPVAGWTLRHEALAAALLFLAAFEAASTLENARNLAGVAADVVSGLGEKL